MVFQVHGYGTLCRLVILAEIGITFRIGDTACEPSLEYIRISF